jgi:hypothetical protein
MKNILIFSTLFLFVPAISLADIPATPVMTLYRFNGALTIPFYSVDSFIESGPVKQAGTLAQGTSVVPCLVISDGKPLADKDGTPYVGFEVIVDSRKATHASTAKFKQAVAARKTMTVPNHHCGPGVKYVMSVRGMYDMEKAPFFFYTAEERIHDAGEMTRARHGKLDKIVRAFHNSPQCELVNQKLVGRRERLAGAWAQFIADNQNRWRRSDLERAKNLDYVMRTAIYEGHLDRGCNAYGACERNIVALSIRNRGQGSGDYQAVSSRISQYNIWDEFVTQVSGITSCFLDPENGDTKVGRMYGQSVSDVERILYGDDRDLRKVFPGTPPGELTSLKHYYHPPAMSKCYPGYPRVEYMSGAIARKGNDYALIANTRIDVGKKVDDGYEFRIFDVKFDKDRDVIKIIDSYPGFVVDGKKVSLKQSQRCSPYGVSRGCRFSSVGRYRKTPPWLGAGRPVKVQCSVRDFGEGCTGSGHGTAVSVGGACDKEMVPVAGVR